MLRKIITGVLLLPALLHAEPVIVDKKVVCGEPKTILTELMQKYNERIIWFSRVQPNTNQFALFVNQDTGTWTIVEQVKDKLCILGDGTGYGYLKQPESKNDI